MVRSTSRARIVKNTQSLRALVIEDDEVTLAAITSDLKKKGLSIDTTELGSEGLDKVRRERIDIIFTSTQVRDLKGQDLIGKLRRARYRAFIVAVGKSSSARQVVAAIQKGADDFLARPVKPGELRSAVNGALRAIRHGVTHRFVLPDIDELFKMIFGFDVAEAAGAQIVLDEEKLDHIRSHLTSMLEKNASLEDELNESREALSRTEVANDQLKDEMDALKVSAAKKTQAAAARDEKVRHLAENLRKVKAELLEPAARDREAAGRLQAERDHLISQNGILRSRNEALGADLAAAKGELAGVREDSKAFHQKILELESSLQSAVADRERFRKSLAELKSERARIERTVRRLQERSASYAELESELAVRAKQKTEAERTAAAAQELARQVPVLTGEKRAAEKKAAELELRVQELAAESDALKTNERELRRCNGRLEQQIKSLDARARSMDALEAELKRSRTENAALNAEAADAKDKQEIAQRSAEEARAELASAGKREAAANERMRYLESRISHLCNERNGILEEFRSARGALREGWKNLGRLELTT